VRVPTDGQTHRQTDRQTDTQTQTDFIICPMLYAIAMGQITSHITTYYTHNLCVYFYASTERLLSFGFHKFLSS